MIRLARIALTAARAAGAPRVSPLEATTLPLRVMPTDVDENLHMNNGRYFEKMELGRVDHVVRSGMAAAMLRERALLVIADVSVDFARPLPPLARYELSTRVVAWRGRSFFMEHRFEHGGRVAARALVRLVFRSRGRTLDASAILAPLAGSIDSPEIPQDAPRRRARTEVAA